MYHQGLIAQLKTLGFEPLWDGEESEMEHKVPGKFGVTVTVKLADYDDQPLEKPLVSLGLPHQCDSWMIVDEEADPSAAQLEAMTFTNEINQGRAVLDSVLIKLARNA